MSLRVKSTGSLRRRLIAQLMVSVAILSLLLYGTVRLIAEDAAETTQDNILGASVASIIDEILVKRDEISIDIPYSSLSMLGSISNDRVFYRITVDGKTLTGYDDLPSIEDGDDSNSPVFWTEKFRNNNIRLSKQIRSVFYAGNSHAVAVIVGQTRTGKALITSRIANIAAIIGLGFFVIAGTLSWIGANNVLQPMQRVEQSVQRRGPQDMRPINIAAPEEVVPLLEALNSFMDRLRVALSRTENFITEAAHRVRTPLATVRANAEIALRGTKDHEQRKTLLAMIRAVDESSRSAGQLLDHAMVSFRSEQITFEPLDLSEIVSQVVMDLTPISELRDISLNWRPKIHPLIAGDKILLIGAVRNLLDNAIKYSPRESAIHISVDENDKNCTVHICDRGRGIGNESDTSLKKRFKRGENAVDVVGSGLGLTIADEVALAHQGSLNLRQNKGQGTCVSFSLPVI